jgi:amino acid transporter
VLSMNTATMDGSRALYGIAQDGMTIKWLGKLNGNNVPGNAMTLDAVLNLVLLFIAIGALAGGGYLKILAVSNFGYVIAHIFAISGFLLLRKDRPGWPRPIRLGPIWTPLAVLCLVLDIVYVAVGSWSFSLTGYAGGSEVFLWGLIVLVIAVALYVYRVVVEDKAPLRWKLDAPVMPAEEPTRPAAT